MSASKRFWQILFWALFIVTILHVAPVLRAVLGGTKLPFVYFVPPFFVVGFAHAIFLLGPRRAVLFLLLCVVICFASEYIGSTTGYIFGPYHYSDDPEVQRTVTGVKLFGHVPWTIPLVWFVMLYPALIISNLLLEGAPFVANRKLTRVLWLSLLGALVITAWDLTMDPYSVGVHEAWIWEVDGDYLVDIPFTNYYGWVGVSFVVMLIYRLIEPRLKGQEMSLVPDSWSGKVVLAMPLSTYAFMTISDLIFGYPQEAAPISPFVMGLPLVVAGTRLALWKRADDPPV